MNLSIVRKPKPIVEPVSPAGADSGPRVPEGYCLPPGYQLGRAIVSLDPQHAVAARCGSSFAIAEIIRIETGLEYILDLGCSYAEEQPNTLDEARYIGVGSGLKLALVAQRFPQAKLICKDLQQVLELDPVILAQSVVVCDGTLGELADPGPLLTSLAKITKIAPYVIVSVVDRLRVSSPLYLGPPARKGVVREWSFSEFAALMKLSGVEGSLYGHTIYHGLLSDKLSMMLLAGKHAAFASAPPKRVLSIVGCFNDADIIKQSITHMLREGLSVWAVDNWSSDGTWEILQSLQRKYPKQVVQLERFPKDAPDKEYNWQGILARKETIAHEARDQFDWFIHHDSDEIRTSPWPGISVAAAISFIDHMGYSAINHLMMDFRPTQDGFDASFHPKEFFSHFEFNTSPSAWMQVKGWQARQEKVDLLKWGGHEAVFEGRKVFPLRFLLAHYSLRSIKQANDKIYKHRLPRFGQEERSLGWHMHYDHYKGAKQVNVLWNVNELIPFSPSFFDTEFFLERLTGLNLKSPVVIRTVDKLAQPVDPNAGA